LDYEQASWVCEVDIGGCGGHHPAWGLVLVSIVMESSSGKSSLPVSFAAVGGRRMVIGTNGGLSDQRTLKDLRDGEDPLSSSKRRVPNGPDPIHNRYHLFLACKHGMCSFLLLSSFFSFF